VSENEMTRFGGQGTSPAQNPVTAIDIVLEPDATMIQHALDANAGLRKNFPEGYSLDAEHKPHIPVMGGYFYTANLEDIYVGVEKALASENKELGLGGILVEPTADMIRLQKKLIDALTHSCRPLAAPRPLRPRLRSRTSTRQPSMPWPPTLPCTSASITARTSRLASAPPSII